MYLNFVELPFSRKRWAVSLLRNDIRIPKLAVAKIASNVVLKVTMCLFRWLSVFFSLLKLLFQMLRIFPLPKIYPVRILPIRSRGDRFYANSSSAIFSVCICALIMSRTHSSCQITAIRS